MWTELCSKQLAESQGVTISIKSHSHSKHSASVVSTHNSEESSGQQAVAYHITHAGRSTHS